MPKVFKVSTHCHSQAKYHAAKYGQTLQHFVEEALEQHTLTAPAPLDSDELRTVILAFELAGSDIPEGGSMGMPEFYESALKYVNEFDEQHKGLFIRALSRYSLDDLSSIEDEERQKLEKLGSSGSSR